MTTEHSEPIADTPDASESADMPPRDTAEERATDAPTEPATVADDEDTTASTTTASTTTASTTETPTATEEQLVPREAAMDFKARWEAIQQGFVDDPRSAVSDADSLVSDVLKRLSTSFEDQHGQLESQWSDGEPDTEQLRAAFQRYRDFFDRLLTL